MKICPQCQKTYNDENLNFCLEDGAVLSQANVPQTDDKLPETVMMSAPRPTSANQSGLNQSPPAWGHEQQQSQPTWGATPNFQAPVAQQKSKSWIWVLGILAGVAVVCGGGIFGLFALIMSVETESANNDNKAVINLEPKSSPSTNNNFEKIDLSERTDVNPKYASAEFKNGEFIMGTKEKLFYYVLVTSAKFQTDDATTRLSVRNVDEEPSRLGYGLIFHSDPTPLTKDYGFLIDADRKRYRVVQHTPKVEKDIIKWTSSAVIKDGTQKNVLEVRDRNGEISLFINGQKVDSIKNSDGYKGGVAGIYSGDGVLAAFSDFEISK